jgi:hypothetical protein
MSHYFHFLTAHRLTSVVAHDAQLASGPRRYSAGSFRPSRSPTSFDVQTIHPRCPTYAFAQGTRLFVSSPATRAPTSQSSSSTPTTTRRSILSRFLPSSFPPSANGSIPTWATSTSFRKIVALSGPKRRPLLDFCPSLACVVEHPVRGRKAYRLLHFHESSKLISRRAVECTLAHIIMTLNWVSPFLPTRRRSCMVSR